MVDGERVAYFSMELALDKGMPTYSGGLGVLAGDTVRAAADLKVPMVAVTLLHRKGYFFQVLDVDGQQSEEPVEWVVGDFVKAMDPRVTVTIEGRSVHLRAWRYEVKGVGDFTVPVYLLDADLPENTTWDRTLTDSLYGGDSRYRLCQEVILGIGGVRMLRALGYDRIVRFHMNEGHASLLGLELLEERHAGSAAAAVTPEDVAAVRQQCVFTTHTPVPAGHDQFPMDLAAQVLGEHAAFEMKDVFCCDGALYMTYLGLSLSHYVNGVAKKHGEISQHMFAPYVIDSITNGVDAATWTSKPFQELFDRHISGWREDNFSLRYALGISSWEVWAAHAQAKEQLLTYVNREANVGMDRDVLTLGFARRAAAYKRGDLLFHDLDRLRKIVRETAPLQVVFAGKAHPHDAAGKELLKRIFRAKSDVAGDVRV
ncbi:MAG TPA: alpha-glucan family phosphorylase, partial [Planctomycetota bacterium]|nr:alpha-glucan family phosphorylase [Planctomycetota bacterium]